MLRGLFVTVFICLGIHVTHQQSSFSGQNPQAKVFEYYMDSHAECGKTFELGLTPATVYGKGAVQTSDSPLSCTIILSTDGIREHRRFSIELVTGFINSQGVNFYIYDGQWTQNSGAQTLASFSYFNNPPTNMQRLITSGGFVTFSLTRDSADLYGYGFVITVTPIPADISNPNNCDQGAGYGCESYHYNPVITKTEVIYIVAAIFGVALVIIVPSVVIYCYVRQRGLTRRWQERRLKDGAPNTAATSLNGSMRSVPVSSRPWQSDISKQPFSSIKKSPASSRRWSRPPTDDESVFDDYPRKPPPPPPPYEEHDQYRVARNGRDYPPRRRDHYDRDGYDRDRDRRYRERRHSGSSYNTSGNYSDEKNDSFVQADDDHPQENFVERIIEPRVHPKSAGKVNRKTEDEEDSYDSIGNLKSAKKDMKKTNSETQCNRESDSEASPETESEAPSTDEEEVSSHSEEEEQQDPRTSLYAQPDKARKKGKKKSKTTADKPVAVQPPPATANLPQPVLGVPFQARPGMVLQRPPLQGFPMMPPNQAINPSLRFMPPVGQIVRPAYPVPNQFNPAGQMHPPNPAARLPMTAMTDHRTAAPIQNLPVAKPRSVNQQLNNSGEAPKYSYLVNRGYDTGRTSPVSSTTSYSHQSYVLDESAVNIDLGSGVDFMKRTTDV